MNTPPSLSPEEFHERLAASLPDSTHDGSLEARVARDIASGRRTLRHRRAGAILASAACVAAVATGFALIPGDGPDQRNVPSKAPDPGEQRLLDRCDAGIDAQRVDDLIFASEDPVIKTRVSSEFQEVLALESADGRYWAQCVVHLRPGDPGSRTEPPRLTVYDATETSAEFGGYSNAGCGLLNGEVDPTCGSRYFARVDRLPDEVAAVDFYFADGSSARQDTVDGYYAVNHLTNAPEEPSGEGGLLQVTYLDSDGNPIAAMIMDGTGDTGAGLPLLSAYPSLRGEEIN